MFRITTKMALLSTDTIETESHMHTDVAAAPTRTVITKAGKFVISVDPHPTHDHSE